MPPFLSKSAALGESSLTQDQAEKERTASLCQPGVKARGKSSSTNPATRPLSKNGSLRPVPKAMARSVSRSTLSWEGTNALWPLAVLCSLCEGIFCSEKAETWYGEWHDHHPDHHALRSAAESGCELCARVLQEFLADLSEMGNETATQEYLEQNAAFGFQVTALYGTHIAFSANKDEDGFHPPLFEFQLSDPSKGTLDGPWTISKILKSTDSPETWSLCRHWLYTCRTTHEECGHRESDSGFQPSRLVHVFLKNGRLHARLHCEPSGRHAPYLTLSHCWGLKSFYVLTRDNLAVLQRAIPLKQLPKNMLDALDATVKLGFKFMWIDSLCIVQDSEQDWLKESSQMGTIYKNSACNLAATAFRDGTQGMFVERDPKAFRYPRVQTQWAGAWPDGTPRKGEYYLLDPYIWVADIDQAPLNERGWVIQERLLSPCILHFGARQIFWECFTSTKCEVFPLRFPDAYVKSADFKKIMWYGNEKLLRSYPGQEEDERRIVHRSWRRIVETYSRADLTRPNDKLVALSGVAKEVGKVLNDRYLAGLWKSDLLHGLLWTIDNRAAKSGSRRFGLPLPPRAPSWSWASIDAAISYELLEALFSEKSREILYCNVADTFVIPCTEDETGMVNGGHIRITGPLSQARLIVAVASQSWQVAGQSVKIEAKFDLGFSSSNDFRTADEPLVHMRARKQEVLDIAFKWDFLDKIFNLRIFYLLPILSYVEFEQRVCCGLILTPTGRHRGEYIRIGAFQAEDEDAGEVLLAPAQRLPIEAFEECDESNESIQYTIKIV